jgi:Ca-activated chloride channel family protein
LHVSGRPASGGSSRTSLRAAENSISSPVAFDRVFAPCFGRRVVAPGAATELRAAAFAATATPEAAFDRGNALVMRGQYADAIKSYDRALTLRPGWKEAEDNRAIAVVRRDRMTFQGGDNTGGQVKADKIVFEKGKNSRPGEKTDMAGGRPLSDEELRGLWLRRVRTKPADFLRAKFAFQEEAKEGGAP